MQSWGRKLRLRRGTLLGYEGRARVITSVSCRVILCVLEFWFLFFFFRGPDFIHGGT